MSVKKFIKCNTKNWMNFCRLSGDLCPELVAVIGRSSQFSFSTDYLSYSNFKVINTVDQLEAFSGNTCCKRTNY